MCASLPIAFFNCKQFKLFLKAAYLLIIPLSLLNLYIFFVSPNNHPNKPLLTNTTSLRRCDFAHGRWVPDEGGPPYNDTWCKTIKPGQNCISHGRPDRGYLHWRWRPFGCELARFSAADFLLLLANKHIAFVGDSLARNQLESLLCLVSSNAGEPDLVYSRGDESKFRRWVFRSHNVTVSVYWSPFLVKGIEKSPAEARPHNQLFLDSADEGWAEDLGAIDVAVFSVGHWFLLPGIFYGPDGGVVGCHHCESLGNQTETGFFDGLRRATRTALKEAVRRMGEGRTAVLMTFSPAHFEGEWDKAGACERKEPYGEGDKEVGYTEREMRRIAVEEAAAAGKGESGRVRVEVLDVTRMAMMRPDGHPGPYMHPNPFQDGLKDRVQNDCVHWCLPGPIDAWNDVLSQLLRTYLDREEETDSSTISLDN